MGEQVMVYLRDKWQPAELVEIGRKWAYVIRNGKSHKTKVPKTAVRRIGVTYDVRPRVAEAVATAVKECETTKGYKLVEDNGYLKIKRDGKLVGLFVKAFWHEAAVALRALEADERDH